MLELFQMWALVEALSLLCLPLTMTVFHNLPDRGWAFSKAIGVALLAFCVWLPLMVLHFLPFTQLFIAGVLLILLALQLGRICAYASCNCKDCAPQYPLHSSHGVYLPGYGISVGVYALLLA